MKNCVICNTEFEAKPKTSGLYCSISCSNVGRYRQLDLDKRSKYELSPTLCERCKSPLTYEQHGIGNKYCGHSCSAKQQPKRRKRNKQTCVECGSIFLAARTASFCSTKCGTDHQWKKKKAEIERGEVSKRTTLKKYLIERDGHRCSDCGATEWKNEPVPVELHHIDGNASNNTVSNMCIICPNCHAMTPNAKGRNKGYGRGTLGIKMN